MKNKNTVILLNILLISIITVCVSLFLRSDLLSGDDIFQCVLFPIKTCLNGIMFADNGCYLCWIMTKIVSLGSTFGVHPQSNYLSGIVRGLDIAILCFLIPSFAFLKKKDNYLMPFFVVFSFFYFLNIIRLEPKVLTDYAQHFRYIFGSLFYFGFWSIAINYFLEEKLPEKNNIYRNTVLAFLVGISNEFCIFSSIGVIIFLFVYAVASFGLETKWVVSEISAKSKKLGYGIYVPLSSFIVGMILWLSNPSFVELFKYKILSGGHFVTGFLKTITEFLSVYFRELFKLNFPQLIVVILLIGLLLFYKNKISNFVRVLISAFSLILGSCFFYFLPVIFGETNFSAYNDLQILWKLVLLAVIFLLSGTLLKVEDIRNACKNKKVIVTFIITAVFLSFAFKNNIKIFYFTLKAHYVWLHNLMEDKRSTFYKTEKMYTFYMLKNKMAVLSKEGIDKEFINLNDIFASQEPKDLNGITSHSPFIDFYYPAVYKDNKNLGYKFVNDQEAMKEFISNGGKFENYEIKKADFNKLLDKDFVLNKKSKSKNQ